MKLFFALPLLFLFSFNLFSQQNRFSINENLIEFVEPDSAKQINDGETSITVRTDSRGARVYLNGTYKGLTPVSINNLVPGNYLLEIQKDGCKKIKNYIQVENGISANYYFLIKNEDLRN